MSDPLETHISATPSTPDPEFQNPDLAPTRPDERWWTVRDFAVLWVSMAACVPTYMLASSMIKVGMNWWQAILTVFLGNAIVVVPMVLNAHAGTKYGIPFPVFCRASFGLYGANVPAMLRALVACGWFGIQCWIGGAALYELLSVYFPEWNAMPRDYAGIRLPEMICFLAFWSLNMLVIWRGIESIRFLLNIKAPLLIILGLALLAWAVYTAGGFGPILEKPSDFDAGQAKPGQFWVFFFPALTGMVGFWATLSLNIPDFSRYARSQKDQVLGQAFGLPFAMGLYAFIGVVVTSATAVIFDETIWDPVKLVAKLDSPLVHAIALVGLCLATLATNLAANVVGPANDFANLWPRKISFRVGGLITGIIGVLIQPWHLVADPHDYFSRWLIAYSSLLGAVGGILIADYYLIRGTKLDAAGLYRRSGPYWYVGGFNVRALMALAVGIAPCLPGFLLAIGAIDAENVEKIWRDLYDYAWFISFGVSFGLYAMLMRGK